jgi:hypothetical protein
MKGKGHIAILLISLLFFAFSAAGVGAQDSSPRVWLSSDVSQATAGQEFTVTVNVAGAVGVYGGSFQLQYDAEAFEVISPDGKAVIPGAFFEGGPSFALKNSADAATGLIDYALTMTQPAQPVTGDGVLGTIQFRALKDAPVTMIPLAAELVSPEFTEVDGRLIAQKINQVAAQITETVSGDTLLAAPSVIEEPVEVVPTVDMDFTSVSAAVPQTLTEERQVAPNNKMLVVAGLFFMGGLMLLTVSVGMYSKMRVRFSLAGEAQPEHLL